ncbi:MAG: HDOD domain-containing protein [Desulfobacterales bacterium]
MPTTEAILKKYQGMKSLPQVAIRLNQLIADPNSTMKQFEEIIRLDPTLVLRLLQLVNSSYFALRQKVESISRAVALVGMKNLNNLIVISAVKDVFEEGANEDIFSRVDLWLHCAAVSICAKMISERVLRKRGEDAHLCGILHDIGMIIEEQVAPDLFYDACESYLEGSGSFTEHETEIIGTNHCDLGYAIAQEWSLPEEVQTGIRDHHNVGNGESPETLSGMIQISDYIVSRLKYPAMHGMRQELSPDLAQYVRDKAAEFKVLVKSIPNEMTEAKEIYGI